MVGAVTYLLAVLQHPSINVSAVFRPIFGHLLANYYLPLGSHCRYYCSFAVSLRYLLQLLYAYCPFALRVSTYFLFRKDQLSKDFVRGTLSTQPWKAVDSKAQKDSSPLAINTLFPPSI